MRRIIVGAFVSLSLFADGVMPDALKLTRSITSPSGVLIATYQRAGEIQTGSFDLQGP